jgi:TolA-binding protein
MIATRSKKVVTMNSPSYFRISVLIGVAVGVLTKPSIGQEPAAKTGQTAPASRTAGDEPKNSGRIAERTSDTIKFANGLLRQRKFDLAAEEFERVLKAGATGSDLRDARYGLANARLHQGRYPDALRAFDDFLKDARADTRVLTARYRLGELSYLLGDLPRARRELETYTGAANGHAGLEMAWTYLGDVYSGLSDPTRAKTAYEKSLSAYPNGRMADRARFGLGRALSDLGDRDQALRLFQKLRQQGGAEWVDRAWLQIGLIRQSGGEFAEAAEALASLERAAPQSSLRSEARFVRAKCLSKLGRPQEAESVLRPLAADPKDPFAARAALELATIDLDANRADAALTALDAALARFPKSPEAPALLFRSAEALQKQNRRAEAQARFLKLAESDPKDPWADDALKQAAQLALEQEDAPAVRRLAANFVARFPDSPLLPQVRLIEARAASLQGKPTEAVAILEPLLAASRRTAHPKTASVPPSVSQAIRYELALAYRALGRSADAATILSQLTTEGSGAVTADAQFLLGQAHIEGGRFAAAIAPLEKYLAANPKGEVAEYALAHLVVAHIGTNQLEDAWKTLASLAARFPQSKLLPPTRLRLAEAALRAQDLKRAAEQLRLVAGMQPTTGVPAGEATAARSETAELPLRIRALAGLGRALGALGEPANAAAAYERILELAPNDPIASQIALERARSLESARESASALDAYSQVIKRFSDSDQAASAILARARLMAKLGRNKDAGAEFDQFFAKSKAPAILANAGLSEDSVLAEWGWTLIDAKEPAQADRVFARLLEKHPESPYAADARFNLAESANEAHDYAKVVNLLSPLVASGLADPKIGAVSDKSPDDHSKRSDGNEPGRSETIRRLLPAVLYRLGRTQVELKEWKSALATLDRLMSDFPENPYRREAGFLRAVAALEQRDFAIALAGLAALLKEPPVASDPKGFISSIRLKQIECWIGLSRWKDVVDATQRLKADLPADDAAIAEVDFARARALLGLGQLEAARKTFESVINSRKEHDDDLAARAQLMCGESYFHEDHFHEALREFLKVDILYQAPRWQAAALLEAGKVYERLDQWPDAAEIYQRLLSRFPQDPSAAEARNRLRDADRRAAAASRSRANG